MEPRGFSPGGSSIAHMSSCSRSSRYALGVLFLLVVAPATAGAQVASPPTDAWESGRWRFGPLAVTPKVELKNLGWDSNVFNETGDPKSDFTATVSAPIDWWLRLGRARLHGVDTFEGVYFAEYTNQGGFNQKHELTFLVPLNRIRPYVGGSYLSTNDRPGYEINERIRHTEAGGYTGAVVRLAAKVDLDISGRQTTYRYEEEADASIYYSETLDRRIENYGAQLRYKVTSLTTLTLLGDSVRERYTQAVDRDNDGFRVLPGVEFDPAALIKGKAQAGYRKLDTRAPGMPDFSGLVANLELSYVLLGRTRFTVGASRDIHFSYSVTEPFYVQPGFTLGVTQQVAGPWDVQARGAWYKLEYQQVDTGGLEATTPDRVDRYETYGGGIGYRVGRDIRVGLNLDYVRRESVLPGQSYDGLRGGVAATYVVK
jgi:hypothetical protein